MHWVGLAHPLKTSLIMYVLDGRLWIGGENFLDRSSMVQREYDTRQMPRWKFSSTFPDKSGFQSSTVRSSGGKSGTPAYSMYSQLDTLVSRREWVTAMGGITQEVIKRTAEVMQVQSEVHVLQMGAGHGLLGNYFAHNVMKDVSFHGYDCVPRMRLGE